MSCLEQRSKLAISVERIAKSCHERGHSLQSQGRNLRSITLNGRCLSSKCRHLCWYGKWLAQWSICVMEMTLFTLSLVCFIGSLFWTIDKGFGCKWRLVSGQSFLLQVFLLVPFFKNAWSLLLSFVFLAWILWWCGARLGGSKTCQVTELQVLIDFPSMSYRHKRNTITTPPYVILSIRPPQQIIYSP